MMKKYPGPCFEAPCNGRVKFQFTYEDLDVLNEALSMVREKVSRTDEQAIAFDLHAKLDALIDAFRAGAAMLYGQYGEPNDD